MNCEGCGKTVKMDSFARIFAILHPQYSIWSQKKPQRAVIWMQWSWDRPCACSDMEVAPINQSVCLTTPKHSWPAKSQITILKAFAVSSFDNLGYVNKGPDLTPWMSGLIWAHVMEFLSWIRISGLAPLIRNHFWDSPKGVLHAGILLYVPLVNQWSFCPVRRPPH